jgi:PAS domain S-box-containing protein
MHEDDGRDLLNAAPGEAADLWRQALAAAGDAVWVWDVAADRMHYCGALAAWLGLAPEALGRSEAEAGLLQHPEDRPEVLRRLTQHLAGEQPQFAAEYRMRCADGSSKWILARGQVVQRDAQGRPCAWSAPMSRPPGARSVSAA